MYAGALVDAISGEIIIPLSLIERGQTVCFMRHKILKGRSWNLSMHHAPSEKFFFRLGKRSVSHTLSSLSSPGKISA
jgi:hypothetical protein